ncbi:hypothetical protein H8B04_14905 [Sphingobacterium sp. DN04309]|uniref:MORN repeat variant n=2 Tax=Sphingobacterium litopenaei TaxID=2763500 RepID=A0ABR7YHN2_9SPHI|nr:hypothetical protein [Sphingobacterium litopenaei]
MIYRTCIILYFLFSIYISFAQEIQFREPATKGYMRFFYDDNYYLVDKDCEFKAIERVAQYDTINFKFNGEFKDFLSNGRLILHGAYKNGIKHGNFTAYHPNGEIKWETVYVEGKESGEWKYYYPDGKPLLVLSLAEDDFKILSYWDKNGNQKVANGNGQYEMTFPVKGFTDHGFTAYRRYGKVSNGKPDGIWYINFITNPKKNTEENIFREIFENGERISISRNTDYVDYFIPYDDFLLVPSDFFSRAENFVVHTCTFDEYSGFTTFLSKMFVDYLEEENFSVPDTSFKYQVKYSVTNNGIPTAKKPISELNEWPRSEKNKLQAVFESVVYFIPSILEGKPIKDNITLSGDFQIIKGTAILKYLNIEREKGQ